MTANQTGWTGVVVAAVLIWLFFFHTIGLFLLLVSGIIGYPIGLIAWRVRRKTR